MRKFFKGLILFIKNMLSKGTSESSKRTMGVAIIVNVIVMAYICVLKNIEAPEIVETIFWGAIILLGVELASGTVKYFSKTKTQEKDVKE